MHVMIWIDWDFDYSDELARQYMKYKGEYYDVGTICKIKGMCGQSKLVRFTGWHYGDRNNFELIDKSDYGLYNTYDHAGVNDYCLEIVDPVRPNLIRVQSAQTTNRDKPPSWDVEVAWIWYIVIMVFAAIFKDRLLIWVAATAVFFLWKNGFMNNKKK